MSVYCTECGTKNENNRSFCGECGAKLPETVLTAKQGQAVPSVDLSFWRKWSKRTKIIVIASVSVVILCVALFQTGKYLTDQDRLIRQFEQAVKSEDASFLQDKLITLTGGEELNAEQAMDLIQYMKQDPVTLEEIVDSMKDKNNLLVMEDEESEFSSTPELVTLRKNGKILLLFDKYEFILRPVHISLYSNYSQAAVSLNGNLIADELIYREGDQMVIGPLIPGKYDIKGEIITDYIEVSADRSVQAYNDVQDDLVFDIQTIDIRSPFPNTKLYANGTDTGMVLNNEEKSFGPVTLDGKLELYGVAEAPFGELRSEPVLVDGYWVGLNFTAYDEVLPSIMTDANKFILSWYKALNALDPAYLTNATENYNNNLSENPRNTRNYYGIEREFVKQTRYGVDNLSLIYNDGAWEADITVAITTTVEKYSDLALQLRLIYSESQQEWQVDQLYSTYAVNATETKEHSFDIAEQEKNTPKAKVPLEADNLISNYLYGLVDAINYNNFYYVESYLYPDSELYKNQTELIERLYNNGVREEVVSFTVQSSDPLNDGSDAYKIRVSETIRIYKESGEEENTYEWWYYSKPYNEEQLLYKIEKVQ